MVIDFIVNYHFFMPTTEISNWFIYGIRKCLWLPLLWTITSISVQSI